MKKILLIISIFFLAGCSVSYDLHVGKDGIKEITSSSEKRTLLNDSGVSYCYGLYNAYLSKPIPLSKSDSFVSETNEKMDDVKYYEIKDFSSDKYFGLKSIGNFDDVSSLANSNALFFGKVRFDYKSDEGIVSVDVWDSVKAFSKYNNLDEIVVNITSDYKVFNDNADKVSDSKYTWIINRDNYKTKKIKFSYELAQNRKSSDSMMIFRVCIVAITIFVFIIYIFFKKIYNKKNSL